MFKNYLGLLILGAYLITDVAGVAEWYIAADGHEYLIDPERDGNWKDAQESCASRNLSLVTFSCWEKYIALIDLLDVSGGYNFWTGGSDSSDNDDGCYWIGRENDFEVLPSESNETNDQIQCVHVGDYGVICHSHGCDDFKMSLLCEVEPDCVACAQDEDLSKMPDGMPVGLKAQKVKIGHLLAGLKSKGVK